VDNFSLISPDTVCLDYPDNTFDFILSNQVLYYLPSIEHLKKVCAEMKRVLKPGGYVFFTMMGPANYYLTHHLKSIKDNGVFEIRVEEEGHRLNGVQELILGVKDEEHLITMFDDFEVITTGYFDQKMFDLKSNQHFIFVGQNKK
jgi:ubiquinone/menaquinone biosynthesis C-methylase UbiE